MPHPLCWADTVGVKPAPISPPLSIAPRAGWKCQGVNPQPPTPLTTEWLQSLWKYPSSLGPEWGDLKAEPSQKQTFYQLPSSLCLTFLLSDQSFPKLPTKLTASTQILLSGKGPMRIKKAHLDNILKREYTNHKTQPFPTTPLCSRAWF